MSTNWHRRLVPVPDEGADDTNAAALEAAFARLERDQARSEAAEARAALTAARAEAQRILADARDVADRTWIAASESARREAQRIVAAATEEAARLVADTKAVADAIRRDAPMTPNSERPARPPRSTELVLGGAGLATLIALVLGVVLGRGVAALGCAAVVAGLLHTAGTAGRRSWRALAAGLPALAVVAYLSVPTTAPGLVAPLVTVTSLLAAVWGARRLART